MKIYYEESLRNYGFGGQAKMVRDLFTDEELDRIESYLKSMEPDGISEGELEDTFAYDDKWLCGLLDIDYENDFLKRGE